MKLYMILTKGVHHSTKFQTFDGSNEISPNLYFDRLLLLKVYKISEGLCLVTLESDTKFKEKTIYCFENDKNLVNFDLKDMKF